MKTRLVSLRRHRGQVPALPSQVSRQTWQIIWLQGRRSGLGLMLGIETGGVGLKSTSQIEHSWEVSRSEILSRGRLARNWPVLASRSDISLRYNSTPDKMLSRGKLILNMTRSTIAVLVSSVGKEMVVGIFASLGIAGGRRKLRVVVSLSGEKK